MTRHDLHLHTTWSDGNHRPERVAELARQAGLSLIGITDHAFSTKLASMFQVTDRLIEYVEALTLLKKTLPIRILCGIEIDCSTKYGHDPKSWPVEVLNSLDFVIFEYVDTHIHDELIVEGRTLSELLGYRKRLTVPVGLAHNDLQRNYLGREEGVTSVLSDNDIFVEISKSELVHYGASDFAPGYARGRNWRDDGSFDFYHYFSRELTDMMAEKGVKVVVGSDSHQCDNLENLSHAYDFVTRRGLQFHQLVE